MILKNHVIFDFNGVIVNDEELHFESTKVVLKNSLNIEITSDDYYKFFAGKTNKLGFTVYLNFKGVQENIENLIINKNKIYLELISKEVPVVSSTIRFIKEYHSKYCFSIVTGAIRKEVEFILDKTNLKSFFDVILCSEDFKESKPSPEGYLKAIALSKIPAKNTVIIEDSISGIEAAKNANTRCIALTTTFKREEISHADLIVDELKLEHVEKFFN